MSDDIGTRQLAEVLKFLTQRLQEGIDEGQDIVLELREVVERLEGYDNGRV